MRFLGRDLKETHLSEKSTSSSTLVVDEDVVVLSVDRLEDNAQQPFIQRVSPRSLHLSKRKGKGQGQRDQEYAPSRQTVSAS